LVLFGCRRLEAHNHAVQSGQDGERPLPTRGGRSGALDGGAQHAGGGEVAARDQEGPVAEGFDRGDHPRGRVWPLPAGGRSTKARTAMSADSRAWRTARAVPAAPGASPWTHTVSTSTAVQSPSTDSSPPRRTRERARAATVAGSVKTAPGRSRGTNRPSLR